MELQAAGQQTEGVQQAQVAGTELQDGQQVAVQQTGSVQHSQAAGGQQGEEPMEQQPAERAAALEDIQEQQQQQQVQQQQQPVAELQLDQVAHPELSPLADAAFTLAALASSGLAAPYGLPRNDTLAVRCLQHAALVGGVDAQLALADRWGPGQAGGTGWKAGGASSISWMQEMVLRMHCRQCCLDRWLFKRCVLLLFC